MISLRDYAIEKLFIKESINPTLHKSGINISKYFDLFKQYVEKHNIKILRTKDIADEYANRLGKYISFNKEDLTSALFIIKDGTKKSGIVLNGAVIDCFDDDRLNNYSLVRKDLKHYDLILPENVIIRDIYVSHKNKLEGLLKIWPKEWDNIIIHNTDKKEYEVYPDFGKQGAYLIKKENLINYKKIISETLKNEVNEDDIVYKIFNSNNPFTFMEEIDKNGSPEEKLKLKQNLANVLSEPLSILAVLNNQDGVRADMLKGLTINGKTINDNNVHISSIAVPLKQNFPLADFFVQFETNDGGESGLPVSVKSGHKNSEHGHATTFISCLSKDDDVQVYNNVPKYNKNIEKYNMFMKEYLNYIKRNERGPIIKNNLLTKSVIDDIQNFVLSCLKYTHKKNDKKENRRQNVKGIVKNMLYDTYEYMINVIDDPEMKQEYKQLCDCENFIEKMIINILRLSDNALNKLKYLIGKNEKCHKITIRGNGHCECNIQDEKNTGQLMLKSNAGGKGYTLKIKNNKIVGYDYNGRKGNGQYLCYIFT